MRGLRTTAAILFVMLLMPTAAYADGVALPTTWVVHIAVSLVGLVISVVLLVEALGVRSVALGGAIADKISYVVLAIICLAAGSLALWTGNFVDAAALSQIQFASQVLMIVAMALFAAYFYSVRAAMQRYLKAMTGSEQLARERAEELEREIIASTSADKPDADPADDESGDDA